MEVKNKLSLDQFNQLLAKFPATLIYFYQSDCGICTVLFPKVKEMISQDFPEMELIVLDADQNRELAAQLRMLSVPGIMVFFEGKEFFRDNGLVAIGELQRKVGRLYQMFF